MKKKEMTKFHHKKCQTMMKCPLRNKKALNRFRQNSYSPK